MDKIQRATEIHRGMTPHQMALRVVELEDALELAEEAVRAKHVPDIAKMVPGVWQLVPVELTDAMSDAIYKELGSPTDGWYGFDDSYRAMLAAAPKLGGE